MDPGRIEKLEQLGFEWSRRQNGVDALYIEQGVQVIEESGDQWRVVVDF